MAKTPTTTVAALKYLMAPGKHQTGPMCAIAGDDAFLRHEDRLQKLSLRPSEYVTRQIRVTPYPTEDIGWITEQVGEEICLFSTDYPHVEGGRRPVERFERSLGDASEQVRSRFYAENFVDLMGRGLPAELAR
jgi:predicted TIM-barrel fold metal-dependent hydrolase